MFTQNNDRIRRIAISEKLSVGRGFTIVELLIVIVVIAILAAISIVAYSGVQNRASDTAIKNDLRNIGQAMEAHKAIHGAYPVRGIPTLGAVDGITQVSVGSYGDGIVNAMGTHNLAYCRDINDESIALVAWSKSGNILSYKSGRVSDFGHNPSNLVNTCISAGYPSGTSQNYWVHDQGIWRVWG